MRVVVIGFGIQGKKRRAIAGKECVAVIDPFSSESDYKDIFDVPLSCYDAALVCTPDDAKIEILKYLATHQKHILVEKPLLSNSPDVLIDLFTLCEKNNVICYTAYNHRFEPHFVRMKNFLNENRLGELYHCRLFYGNGTARDVRNSPWRDRGAGVLYDLGSHLIDTLLFWFQDKDYRFEIVNAFTFENKSPDHVMLKTLTPFSIELEMSLLSWRNHFICDLIGEKGSLHIESLCKWGPSRFTYRKRKLPSGRPDDESIVLTMPDPTWAAEYTYFKELIMGEKQHFSSDIKLSIYLNTLFSEAKGKVSCG